jgi:hypothetical protein
MPTRRSAVSGGRSVRRRPEPLRHLRRATPLLTDYGFVGAPASSIRLMYVRRSACGVTFGRGGRPRASLISFTHEITGARTRSRALSYPDLGRWWSGTRTRRRRQVGRRPARPGGPRAGRGGGQLRGHLLRHRLLDHESLVVGIAVGSVELAGTDAGLERCGDCGVVPAPALGFLSVSRCWSSIRAAGFRGFGRLSRSARVRPLRHIPPRFPRWRHELRASLPSRRR